MAHVGFQALRLTMLAAALGTGLSACAPTYTNVTYPTTGYAGPVSYGVIVSMRNVTVSAPPSGVGTAIGVGAGSIVGSSIGRGFYPNVAGAIGGAILGGVIGSAIENQSGRMVATEFVIREHNGPTIAVVQTNEEQLGIGEQVMITHSDRTRLTRAAGRAPVNAYQPQGYAPASGYQGGYGYAPPGNAYPVTGPRAVYPPNYGYDE